MKELKRVSNLWLKEQGEFDDFEWQGGYADFSVSQIVRELKLKERQGQVVELAFRSADFSPRFVLYVLFSKYQRLKMRTVVVNIYLFK